MFGCCVGNCIRTGAPINLTLHPIVWKQLVGQEPTSLRDLETSDMFEFKDLVYIKEVASQCKTNEEFCALIERNFTINYGTDDNKVTIVLCNDGYNRQVDMSNH